MLIKMKTQTETQLIDSSKFLQYLTDSEVKRWRTHYTRYVKRTLKRREIPSMPDEYVSRLFTYLNARRLKEMKRIADAKLPAIRQTFLSILRN